jgi:hypothetical protein
VEVSPINLIVSFIVSFLMSFILIFFVFVSTVYGILDLILIVMIVLMTFFIMVFGQYQIFYGSYPVQVIIFEKRANGSFIFPERAKRIFGEFGKYAYQLKNKKIITKPISLEFIYNGKGSTNWLFLYMPQLSEIQPLTLEEAETMHKKMILTPEAARYWYSEQQRRNFERWGKKFGLEKYAMFIQFAVVGLIIGLLLYIFMGQMSEIVGNMGGITAAQGQLIEKVTDLIKAIAPQGFQLPSGTPPAPLPTI